MRPFNSSVCPAIPSELTISDDGTCGWWHFELDRECNAVSQNSQPMKSYTLTSSAANFSTAVKGVFSGTLSLSEESR